MIPVLTSEGFQRTVTARQHAAEVAGKVLPPTEGLWRRAELRFSARLGDHWFVYYFKPKPIEVEEWANRKPDREKIQKIAH